MQKTVFAEEMEGLMIERVIRDHEYSMISRHFHDSYELYFLLEGERHYFIDKETYLVKKGMVVFVNRSQIHKTSMAAQSYHDRILLQIKGRVFDPFLQQNGMFCLEKLFSRNNGVLELEKEVWEQAEALLNRIGQELRRKQEHCFVMVKFMTAELLLLLYRQRKTISLLDSSQRVQTVKHQKVHEIAEYLLNHCETGESLENLAGRFFISKSYLCRIFKEITGFTINEYQNMMRIKRAKHLLLHSVYSITEISGELGFESISYFERVFKKYTDFTPLRYRKSAHETES